MFKEQDRHHKIKTFGIVCAGLVRDFTLLLGQMFLPFHVRPDGLAFQPLLECQQYPQEYLSCGKSSILQHISYLAGGQYLCSRAKRHAPQLSPVVSGCNILVESLEHRQRQHAPVVALHQGRNGRFSRSGCGTVGAKAIVAFTFGVRLRRNRLYPMIGRGISICARMRRERRTRRCGVQQVAGTKHRTTSRSCSHQTSGIPKVSAWEVRCI